MTMTSMIDYLSSLPPASENNSRAIVKGKLSRFHKSPSEINALQVTRITAGELEADFKDTDLGNDVKSRKSYLDMDYELRNLEEINNINAY
jgi:hypothetical protein